MNRERELSNSTHDFFFHFILFEKKKVELNCLKI